MNEKFQQLKSWSNIESGCHTSAWAGVDIFGLPGRRYPAMQVTNIPKHHHPLPYDHELSTPRPLCHSSIQAGSVSHFWPWHIPHCWGIDAIFRRLFQLSVWYAGFADAFLDFYMSLRFINTAPQMVVEQLIGNVCFVPLAAISIDWVVVCAGACRNWESLAERRQQKLRSEHNVPQGDSACCSDNVPRGDSAYCSDNVTWGDSACCSATCRSGSQQCRGRWWAERSSWGNIFNQSLHRQAGAPTSTWYGLVPCRKIAPLPSTQKPFSLPFTD